MGGQAHKMVFSSRGELGGTASHSHRNIIAVLPAYLGDGTKADTKSEADSTGGVPWLSREMTDWMVVS
jgi:hypothetical protein